MEWRRARWSVCLPLLIFRCSIKFRSSLLAPAYVCDPGKRAVKQLWWCGGVILCMNFELYRLQLSVTSYLFVEHLYSVNQNTCSSVSQVNERQVFTLAVWYSSVYKICLKAVWCLEHLCCRTVELVRMPQVMFNNKFAHKGVHSRQQARLSWDVTWSLCEKLSRSRVVVRCETVLPLW